MRLPGRHATVRRQIWQRVTGSWVTVTGKRRELDWLIASVMQPAEGDLDCAARASQSWCRWYEISSPSQRHDRTFTGCKERDCSAAGNDRVVATTLRFQKGPGLWLMMSRVQLVWFPAWFRTLSPSSAP